MDGRSRRFLVRRMSEAVFIGINRKRARVTAFSLGALAILLLMLMWWIADNQDFTNPMVFKVSGVVLAILVLFVGANAAKKASDSKGGLTIDESGIRDASSSIGLGLIRWEDVKEIRSDNANMLIIDVKRQKHYLNSASNSAIRRLLEHNIKHYKTPIVIDTGYLTSSAGEIEEVLIAQWKKHK